MKNTFFQQNKNLIGIVAAIIVFAAITLIYFNPVLQGKRIKQHDIEMHYGMSQEIIEFRDATGEQTLWTNAPFSGMPAWNISIKPEGNLTSPLYKGLSLGFPHPIGSVFISMLGFFILLLLHLDQFCRSHRIRIHVIPIHHHWRRTQRQGHGHGLHGTCDCRSVAHLQR